VSVRVVVVAEYYPRASDPVLGIWAHRQALAARDAGADVRVLVLHRPIPSRAALRRGRPRELLAPLRQPRRTTLDGLEVRYVSFVAPPRPRSYGSWGAWAALPLRRALERLRPFDLVHAHYAAPAGDAVRRARPGVPVVVSVHGGDLLSLAERSAAGARAVRAGLANARIVLANSSAMAARAGVLGAARTEVVHLGTDLPDAPAKRGADLGADVPGPTVWAADRGADVPRPPAARGTDVPATPAQRGADLVTVAHLVARKRHADVLRALWLLRESHPELRWDVVGDGPERTSLEELAGRLGLDGRVRFRGQLPPAEALAAARAAGVFVLPSVDEAFGVAYVEAMAGGVPAIGCRGEPGPEEIVAAGGGLRLVPPADPEALAAELRTLLDEPGWRQELGHAARATVEAGFTWEQCGRATVAAYEAALQ
jgi:teichuronic acid biosynthesis glycosyltransferase TuaC